VVGAEADVSDERRIEALRHAVEASPGDPNLRLILAETQEAAGLADDALAQYEHLLHRGELPGLSALRAGHLAADHGRVDLARGCLEAARAGGVVEGVGALQSRIEELLERRGLQRVRADASTSAGGLVETLDVVTFADVGGLDAVKKAINRTIVLPLSRPELYERYARRSGGGVLLYGPPGCGKTLVARATAGECQLPFLRVRVEDILDPWVGVSERNLHEAFEQARYDAPCVLFLDEVDALGYARRRQQSSATRNVVDVLLQELDTIGSEGRSVLVLAATNVPWDVEDALLRPGRFDKRIFVPPPDQPAREKILEILLTSLPTEDVHVPALARSAELYSGADLRAAVEHAVDEVIDTALETQGEPPVTGAVLARAIETIRPTTLDWLERAKGYVEFANVGDKYADVEAYLNSKEVRRKLRGSG
jgi:transitional endoplasmic reticulum ATPase